MDPVLQETRGEETEFSCTLNELRVFGRELRVSRTVETILELTILARIAE